MSTLTTLSIAVLVACAALLATAVPSNPTGNVTQIATGFAWLENLWFDGAGGLYATDVYKGRLWKWTRDPVTRAVTQTLWVDGAWHMALGVSASPIPNTILVVAVYNGTVDGDGAGISIVSTEYPNNHTRLAGTPKSGNGLAYNPATGWVYTCNEGSFIPFNSEVMSVNAFKALANLSRGVPAQAGVFESLMTTADGAFVDEQAQLLYLTSSALHEVLVYDIANASTAGVDGNATFLRSYFAPGCWSLDDLCVSYNLPSGHANSSDPYLFVADFLAGALRSFDAAGTESTLATWASGFHALTSAREGRGPGWEGNSIFVTEGGSLDPTATDRGLWEVQIL
jgi:hypothetical protein